MCPATGTRKTKCRVDIESWWRDKKEEKQRFERVQEALYSAEVKHLRERNRIALECEAVPSQLPKCQYQPCIPLKGKSRAGEFALTVVRKAYLEQGYEVWLSDSDGKRKDTFILVSYPHLRSQRPLHPAYKRMVTKFGLENIEELNQRIKHAKEGRGISNHGGGDPDLFIFNEEEWFFVEAKHRDDLTLNQQISFPYIDQLLCPVRIVRLVAVP